MEHPADKRTICGRCGNTYYCIDGCWCDDFEDDELRRVLDRVAEFKYQDWLLEQEYK
jgi:hypothetical protein